MSIPTIPIPILLLLFTLLTPLPCLSSPSLLSLINPLIGNTGPDPNTSGGTIPSISPPFGMTRWVAQTHENYVSRTAYNWSESEVIHGFMGTRQPAVWMGESGCVVVVPGFREVGEGGRVKSEFSERGLRKVRASEEFGVDLYKVGLESQNGNGRVDVRLSATSRVGHLEFTFTTTNSTPYILIQSSRPSTLYSVPTSRVGPSGNYITTYPEGYTLLNVSANEICGYNTERQDRLITPTSTQRYADGFKGYFCARFSVPFTSFGTIKGRSINEGKVEERGAEVSAYATFPPLPPSEGGKVVDVRIGTSFISIAQARLNIDIETPEGQSFDETVSKTRGAWEGKVGRVVRVLEGGSVDERVLFVTGLVRALQFPSEQHEYTPPPDSQPHYYSGYDDSVHKGESYTGYSIWDTYRAEWALLILLAPERIPEMVRSMLQDWKESGWLPMWKNIVETNIMVGTHADSLISESVIKGFAHPDFFDLDDAWEAVWKDAVVPPVGDGEVEYFDRQENVDYEVRAGLGGYADESKGWVADDVHSESVSRTLDYAYDDFAIATLAHFLNKPNSTIDFLMNRAMNAPFRLFNNDTGFVEARRGDGGWAGPDNGFTEGDKWAYTFAVPHNVPRLVEVKGGNESFVRFLDEHFEGGWNDHTNEPSHHIPYLYALANAPYKTQEMVRRIAKENYFNRPDGLTGNEDCGQMSAWYIFTALGFYPVNPVSGEYVVGSPLFSKIQLNLPIPPSPHPASISPRTSPYYDSESNSFVLTIRAPGAESRVYVKSLSVNGVKRDEPVIRHEEIWRGGEVVFEMSEVRTEWGVSREGGVEEVGVGVELGTAEKVFDVRHEEL